MRTTARDGMLTGEKTVVAGAEDATHLIVLATDGLYLAPEDRVRIW